MAQVVLLSNKRHGTARPLRGGRRVSPEDCVGLGFVLRTQGEGAVWHARVRRYRSVDDV